MNIGFLKSKVKEIRSELEKDAKTIIFDIHPQYASLFNWKSGQHVNVQLDPQGQDIRRSYTISSSHVLGESLAITVKRIKDGVASNYINDKLNEADEVWIMPPNGNFFVEPDANAHRSHYFFGAGSGITPLFSMIKTIIVKEPNSQCFLLYGNKNENQIIFHDALEELKEEYEGRFVIKHILSEPNQTSDFKAWRLGRINTIAVQDFIAENPSNAQDTEYYICGPDSMNEDVTDALKDLNIVETRIHFESFTAKSGNNQDSDIMMDSRIEVNLYGRVEYLNVPEGQSILEAMQDAQMDPPYSCQSGLCGSCKAQLKQGTVTMENPEALTPNEINYGTILTCQARATSETLEIEFED
ncbi:ferredoxin--NADP reductase [Curvivirga aplysinae]|uniref:ferredoxin--NADP reductase n=1 Tax=Curvivirga aplysinae TaxID=2529852 RepID=UPI0012BCEE18|nr:ferredoxin--NADP reductase [Curvivirga aplysinae]MTI10313.1 ferredoxin--NADP reductase [Curvivirga aplysinae]